MLERCTPMVMAVTQMDAGIETQESCAPSLRRAANTSLHGAVGRQPWGPGGAGLPSAERPGRAGLRARSPGPGLPSWPPPGHQRALTPLLLTEARLPAWGSPTLESPEPAAGGGHLLPTLKWRKCPAPLTEMSPVGPWKPPAAAKTVAGPGALGSAPGPALGKCLRL